MVICVASWLVAGLKTVTDSCAIPPCVTDAGVVSRSVAAGRVPETLSPFVGGLVAP